LQIKTEKKSGAFVLVPKTSQDQQFLSAVTALKIGSRLTYRSRPCGADVESPYTERMVLSFTVEGEIVFLMASSNASEKILRLIRDACYMAKGIYFLDHSRAHGKIIARLHLGLCKYCENSVADYNSASSAICNRCAIKCVHKPGYLGMKERCSICHRSIPRTA
jgi:hypothetical protein